MSGYIKHIKPCPYCGGEAFLCWDFLTRLFCFVCHECGARTNDMYTSKRAAFRAWGKGQITDMW